MIFWIDGTPVDAPINWNETTSTLRRNGDNDSLLLLMEGSFTFSNDGYDYLASLIDDGFCGKVKIDIFDDAIKSEPSQIFTGYSFVSDWIHDEGKNEISIKIQDNSFYARINNNKGLKPVLTSDKSKNGVDISLPQDYLITFRNVDTNLIYSTYAAGYTIYEAFKYLIAYMTDNTVLFASDTFGSGGDWEGLMVTTGRKIREYNSGSYYDPALTSFSFTDLWDEISKVIPIQFTIEDPFGNPTFRVEEESYFYQGNGSVEFTDLDTITTRFDQNKLYSKVKFGSGDTLTTGSFPETIQFLGYQTEEYPLLYECNIDKELDLERSWICSSNIIQDILDNATDSYDTNLFLIDSTKTTSTLGTANQSNTLNESPAKYYYNARLTNDAIAGRLLGGVPSSLYKTLYPTGTGVCDAERATSYSIGASANPILMDNIITNTGSYYNVGSDRYEAGVGGVYTFESRLIIDYSITGSTGSGGGSIKWNFYLEYKHYDQTGTLLDTIPAYYSPTGLPYLPMSSASGASSGIKVMQGSPTNITLNTGDYVQLSYRRVYVYGSSFTFSANAEPFTYFKCTENTIGGGVYEIIDSDDYPVYIHEFEYPLTKPQWDIILQNQLNSYKFSMFDDNVRYGWISEIKYKHYEGLATIKLISDKNSQANGEAK